MKKRISSLLIILVIFTLTIASFTACSKKENKSDNGSDKKASVVIGIDDTFVPMGFKDDKGEIVGFDVDLAKEVFKRLGIEVKFQPIDWSMKETELNSKNIDLIWNGYTITDERKEKAAFTKPYLENRQVIITLAASKINSKNDLKGKKVAAQNGSSSLDAINKEPELAKAFSSGKPVLFDSNNDAFMDLEAGRTEAVVADEILVRYYITERGADKYKVLQEDFGKEEYGVGIRKQDKELLDKVNKTLDAMKADGTCGNISKKWFGQNIVK